MGTGTNDTYTTAPMTSITHTNAYTNANTDTNTGSWPVNNTFVPDSSVPTSQPAPDVRIMPGMPTAESNPDVGSFWDMMGGGREDELDFNAFLNSFSTDYTQP